MPTVPPAPIIPIDPTDETTTHSTHGESARAHSERPLLFACFVLLWHAGIAEPRGIMVSMGCAKGCFGTLAKTKVAR